MLKVMHGYGIISSSRLNLLPRIHHTMSALEIMSMTGLPNLGNPPGLQTYITGRIAAVNVEYHTASSSECLETPLSLLAPLLLTLGISTTPLMQVLSILFTCPLKPISPKAVISTTI